MPPAPTVNIPRMDSEEERFKKMQMLNGNTFDNGERSQGDQEAEQRMIQNKTTGLLQKFVNMVTAPFSFWNKNPFKSIYFAVLPMAA